MSLSFLRSLLLTDPLIILMTIILGSASLLVSLFDAGGRRQHLISRWWSRVLLLLSGVRVDVRGIEKLQPHEGYVFASNHSSLMDTPVALAFLPVQFRFIAKIGLFSVPILGTHLRRAGHVPVVRDDPRASVKSMGRAARRIQEQKISLLLFPEGHRSAGQLLPFKDGAAYIAIKAGVPIVPVAMSGTHAVLPVGSIQIRGGRVSLQVGNPIPTAGLSLKDRDCLTRSIHEQVQKLLAESAPKPHETR